MKARVLFTIVACVLLWLGANHLRKPFDVVSHGDYGELSSASLMYASNWWREGPWASGFAQLETPASGEVPSDPKSRGVYPSYPGFHLVPLYVASLVAGEEPTHEMATAIVRGAHLLVALVVAIFALVLCSVAGSGAVVSVVGAASAAAVAIFAPGMMYFAQGLYFPDIFVLVLVLGATAAELYRDRTGSRAAGALVAGSVFLAVLTEYYSCAFALALVMKRVAFAADGRSRTRALAVTAAPVVAALAVHVAQLVHWGESPAAYFVRRFFQRTVETSSANVLWPYFKISITQFFDPSFSIGRAAPLAALLAIGLAVFWAAKRRDRQVASLLLLTSLPPFVYLVAFRQYSINHDFSVMKFLPAIALAPLALALTMKSRGAVALAAALTAAFVWQMPWVHRVERAPLRNAAETLDRVASGALVRAHVSYDALVFSRLSPAEPRYSGLDQLLPHTLKPIHLVASIQHLCVAWGRLGASREVFYFERRNAPLDASIAVIADRSYERDGVRLLHLSSESLVTTCRLMGLADHPRLSVVPSSSSKSP